VSDGHGGPEIKEFAIAVKDWVGEFTLGSAADDVFFGGLGNDSLSGGLGADQIRGGVENDILKGDAGNDTLMGGVGADQLWGGLDQDRLFGNAGNDILRGEAGNDTIWGGEGKDVLYGLKGKTSKDVFVFDTKVTNKTYKAHIDTIKDFGSKYDNLWFDDVAFTNKTIAKFIKSKHGASFDKPVKMKADFINFTGVAQDANDFFLVKQVKPNTFKVLYDADGNGTKFKALEIATVVHTKGEGLLSASDFWFV
jgi:Ca2+-binding RTX toxin-like protein